jgi:hypothetical protein
VSLIEAYVTELDSALRGPRGVKADMIAEARDGLLDASEAYERGGLDPEDAQRRAIADFGPVPAIAPDYQTQLGLSQGRKTVLMMCLSLAAQPLMWRVLLPLAGHPQSSGSAAYNLVNYLVEGIGALSIAGGLVLTLALGRGTRYLRGPDRLIRAAGVFALVVCAVFVVLGTLMSAFGSADGRAWNGVPMLALLLYVPLMHVAFAARRCFLTAAYRVRGAA